MATKSSRKLSRLLITGHINENTPLCVLMEIANAHGIKYEASNLNKQIDPYYIIKVIEETTIPAIEENSIDNSISPKNLSQWEYIARFINKSSQWPQSKLINAYNFLIGFMSPEDPLNKIPPDFVPGLQTPEQPFNINACVLYRTCIYHRLHISSQTTINQMAFAVRMLREPIEAVVRRAKIFIERDARKIELINTLMLSPYEIQDPEPPEKIIEVKDYNQCPHFEISFELLDQVHGSLNNIKTLQQRIDPSNNIGAIALAAMNYNLDISKSQFPLREYRSLRTTGLSEYRPIDPWMNYWYTRNPTLFDLRIRFNPIFPLGFYDKNQLLEMARNEGFTETEITQSSPYELLQIGYVSENFYEGEMPNLKFSITPFNLDELKDIPEGELLSFGALNEPLQPITVSELYDLLDHNRNFTNPFNKSMFTPNAMNKLKIILRNIGPNIRPEIIQKRHQLYDLICTLELLTRSQDESTRQLAFTYRSSSPDTKEAIIKALTNLLHLGMYMRGWRVIGNKYPVMRATVPPEKETEVYLNVTRALAEYEFSCRCLGKIGGQINSLPLINSQDGHYHVSNSSHEGKTIGERIEIVKEGEQSTNIASCIRLSSNWLCASAHKYLIAIGQPAPFDIFHLRYIS